MNIIETKIEVVEYEAPCVESVVEADDIEREVAYAGIMAVSGPSLAA